MNLGLGPNERLGIDVIGGAEGVDVGISSFRLLKDLPISALAAKIENQISIWLSQDAFVGVKWKWTFG